jgi:hypothetical protein
MKINKKYMILFLIIIVSIMSIILLILNYSNIFEKYENSNTTNDLPLPLQLPYDVVIVGCARDIEAHLPNTKQKLEMVKSLFRSSKIIIYENDSKDKTLELLSTWNNENFIKLITEKDVKGIRTERLAYARNLLYKEAMKHNFDLLIVIDLDNVINDLTPESILSCFNKELIDDWAMLGANQTGNYYDMFALKTYDNWMDIDLMKCRHIDNLPEHFCLTDRYKNIPKDDKPIQVKSCFGGTAIYKKKYLNNCDYGKGFQMNGNEKIEFCEHVDFNEGVIKNGGKIYINPKFINH